MGNLFLVWGVDPINYLIRVLGNEYEGLSAQGNITQGRFWIARRMLPREPKHKRRDQFRRADDAWGGDYLDPSAVLHFAAM